MSEWQSIDVAPKTGAPVRLRSPSYDPPDVFAWNQEAERWETRVYALAASYLAWWDEDCEQPTEWAAVVV